MTRFRFSIIRHSNYPEVKCRLLDAGDNNRAAIEIGSDPTPDGQYFRNVFEGVMISPVVLIWTLKNSTFFEWTPDRANEDGGIDCYTLTAEKGNEPHWAFLELTEDPLHEDEEEGLIQPLPSALSIDPFEVDVNDDHFWMIDYLDLELIPFTAWMVHVKC